MNSTTSESPASQRERLGGWFYERLGVSGISYSVPAHANSLPYLLGGITLFSFIIMAVTGIYLAQFYNPQPSDAHTSVIYIITGVPLGDIVRSIHFWTAQILTALVILHLLRILVTASFKRPREFNWYIGLGMLVVTFGLIYTGSVLKFDQEGVEALQHSKEAGELVGVLGAFFNVEFSRSTSLLTRLYTTHVSVLPIVFGALIAAHVFFIKQHGISPKVKKDAVSRPTAGEGESRFDIHLRKMVGYGLILFAIILILGLVFPAQLGQPGVANAEVTKPWWMFLWLFPAEEILGAWALVLVPVVLGLLLALVPVLDRSPYLSPSRRKWLMIVTGIILAIILVSGIVAAAQPVVSHLE